MSCWLDRSGPRSLFNCRFRMGGWISGKSIFDSKPKIRIIHLILLLLFLLIIIPAAVFNLYISWKFQDALQEGELQNQSNLNEARRRLNECQNARCQQKVDMIAHMIAAALEPDLKSDIATYLKKTDQIRNFITSDKGPYSLYVIDKEGKSFPNISEQQKKYALEVHEIALKGQNLDNGIFIGRPIWVRGTVVGSVISVPQYNSWIKSEEFVTANVSRLKVFHSVIMWQAIIGMIGYLAIILLGSVLLARVMARPLQSMSLFLERLRQGDFEGKIPEKGVHEVKEMARSYNALRSALAEKARMDQDLLAAREIQMALLPSVKLDIEGWEVWGMCLPAREVGGDFYFWHTPKDRIYAGVGDISGKGMRASLLAALSMGSLKTVFRGEEDLEHSFSVLNGILFHEFQGKGFLCMNAATLTGNSGQIEFVNAGQSWPILIQDHKTLAYWAIENGDLPLGAIQEPHYRKDPLQLSEGQGLILYSDGGPELKDIKGRLLGFDEFIKILQENMDHDLEAWGRKIADALTAWRGEAPQHDDITVLFLRYGKKKWKTTRIL